MISGNRGLTKYVSDVGVVRSSFLFFFPLYGTSISGVIHGEFSSLLVDLRIECLRFTDGLTEEMDKYQWRGLESKLIERATHM